MFLAQNALVRSSLCGLLADQMVQCEAFMLAELAAWYVHGDGSVVIHTPFRLWPQIKDQFLTGVSNHSYLAFTIV